jgi:predicted metal-dependent enzyme (double-stranded beta helix superfamily)
MARMSQPGLVELVAAVRNAVGRHADWRTTARLVADALEQNLPTADILTAEQRAGDRDAYRSHVLHTEPDGTFSIVALVWCPGQETRIHDHVTWCAFGVIQGVEHEELFTLDQGVRHLAVSRAECAGCVTAFPVALVRCRASQGGRRPR